MLIGDVHFNQMVGIDIAEFVDSCLEQRGRSHYICIECSEHEYGREMGLE